MKKQRFFMLGIITVLVAVLSLTFVSSTFAKYTSTVSGSDSARVAKWAWTYEGVNLGADLEFDLFNTILDTKDDAAETDVAANLIAPGTHGSFEFNFTNNSEVTGKYTIVFSSGEEVAQIKYSLDETTWVEDIASLNTDALIKDVNVAMGASSTVTIYWQWVFEGGVNPADTTLGLNGGVIQTVTANVTFEQID